MKDIITKYNKLMKLNNKELVERLKFMPLDELRSILDYAIKINKEENK